MLAAEIQEVDLEHFMRQALEQAAAAGEAGEVAIGAVVVLDGKVIGRGRARHRQFRNKVRHAELNALLEADACLWTEYARAILFTTVEPCPMCLGAAVMADIPHIIFAKADLNVLSGLSVETNPYIHRHIRSYQGGILEAESTRILAQYSRRVLEFIEGRTQ